MKKLFVLSAVVFLISSYATAAKFRYSFSLNGATQDMVFNDSTISVIFSISNDAVYFKLENKTDSEIQINWDKISLVVLGEAQRVIHSGVKYIEKNNPQSASIIPPMASIQDLALPAENIRYVAGYKTAGSWVVRDLLPMRDGGNKELRSSVLALKGSTLSLYFPMTINGVEKKYNFIFSIENVEIAK